MSQPARITVVYLCSESPSAAEEGVVREAAEGLGASFSAVRGVSGPGAPEIRPGSEGMRVILIGPPMAVSRAAAHHPTASRVFLVGAGDRLDGLGATGDLAEILRRPLAGAEVAEALRRAAAHASLLGEIRDLRRRVDDQGRELRELNQIGVALSAERNTDTLLNLILTKCREITSADAGSLYLVERAEGAVPDENNYFADKILVFRLAQNDSVNVPLRQTRMEISRRSLAGFVALTGEPLHIEDAYAIPAESEYQFNRAVDDASGYRTKSLLVLPMRNHKDEVIGVLQLINRKRDGASRLSGTEKVAEQVIPFDGRTAELASSLSSQAAVAIENARLYEEIQALFEGFIKASVTAIESRDPTTSGHSERVAVLTVGLAEKVDREDRGPFKNIRFTRSDIKEIHYASLLHDFGKIGVRENVLLKGKKLYEHELERVRDRFRFLRRTVELKYTQEKVRLLMEKSRVEALAAAASLDSDLEARLKELDRYLETIVQANEPTVLREEASALLKVVAGTLLDDLDGQTVPLLQPWEASNLSIGKGSLSPEERLEIESHVFHTFQFLRTIPWTRELRQVPQIAHAHHEKLDGSGYPRGIRSPAIPIESRMMTVSDIFDALTAKDRPYKRAMPAQRALDILSAEVKDGKVDADLFRVFVEGRVYELVPTTTGAAAP